MCDELTRLAGELVDSEAFVICFNKTLSDDQSIAIAELLN